HHRPPGPRGARAGPVPVIRLAALALLVATAAPAAAGWCGGGYDERRGSNFALCDRWRVGPVQVAAHRGGALLWPENSLLAFENALALGVDYLETDVHLTGDGEVVVLHDATLDRTTTGQGRVRDVTRAGLAALRLRARDGSTTDQPVPFLVEVLAAIAPTRAQLLLEIKVDAERRRYPGIEEKVVASLRRQALMGRTVIMAFEDDTLRQVRTLDADVRTALLVARRRVVGAPPGAVLHWARRAQATHVGVDYHVLDVDLAAAARGAGLGVAAWTVNDEAAMQRAVEHGAQILITDRPDLALRIVGR
ncbi:MAG: glycerophosphodiester phosphodiesterase, partial [Candidatus Rokuibacteriota bacterium]